MFDCPRKLTRCTADYVRVASPARPVVVGDLPADMGDYLSEFRLPVRFAETEHIDMSAHWTCR